MGLAETRAGGFAARDCDRLAPLAECCSAVVLDAYAMSAVGDDPFDQPIVMTPHAGEMAHLTGATKDDVLADPLAAVRAGAMRWGACVALKGSTTYIAQPDGSALRFAGGSPGLATSGSGDTLAGIIGGLAARGALPLHACAWGVLLHARAGAALARDQGSLGYLARELSAQVPALIHAMGRRSTASAST